MTEDQPKIARHKPYYVELEKGKRYFWCACGRSKNQPYCDGAHKGTRFSPVQYTAQTDGEEVLFCGCKHTADQPFCDGSHNNLRDHYDSDDPDSLENRAIPTVPTNEEGRAMLDGGCFVAHVDRLAMARRDNLRWSSLISAQSGALYQSQFYFEVEGSESPVTEFPDRHVLLFVPQGRGTVTISGRDFPLEACHGAYVRPGEAFTLSPAEGGIMRVYASVCPLADGPRWPSSMPTGFDAAYPDRTIGIDEENRTAMADRFFQVLIGKPHGCDQATQFIGEIPLSKAAVHRHLYEESLIIVSGEGCMWTQGGKAPVGSGDVIFLPRKQPHSLQCTSPDGMMVAGVIYPGDNPGINY